MAFVITAMRTVTCILWNFDPFSCCPETVKELRFEIVGVTQKSRMRKRSGLYFFTLHFSLFTFHFSLFTLPLMGVSPSIACKASCRRFRFAPVAVTCRRLSPAPARLGRLALGRTPLVKTCHRHLFTALTQQGEPEKALAKASAFFN